MSDDCSMSVLLFNVRFAAKSGQWKSVSKCSLVPQANTQDSLNVDLPNAPRRRRS